MEHLHPWYLTLAAGAAAFSMAMALCVIVVWWGELSTAREYRQRTKRLGERPRCRVLDVHYSRDGVPMLPDSLANGTPHNGVRIAGPYRRQGGWR